MALPAWMHNLQETYDRDVNLYLFECSCGRFSTYVHDTSIGTRLWEEHVYP